MNRKTCLRLLCAPLAFVPALALAGEVSLTGEGSVRYQPDSARLQFTASAEHELPQQATEQVATLMSQWRQAINDYQAQLQDYSDASVNLYSRTLPPKDREEEPRTRSVASQTVSFQIDDLALLNPLLEQAQTIGPTTWGPTSFSIPMRKGSNAGRWPMPSPTPVRAATL